MMNTPTSPPVRESMEMLTDNVLWDLCIFNASIKLFCKYLNEIDSDTF